MVQVPGITGRSVKLRFAGEREAEFTGVGAAKDHQASGLEAFDVFAFDLGGRRVGEELRTAGHLDTFDGRGEVFHQEGHTA